MDIIIGTAGHIDHGKTTLIKALTGVNTDRLPEEKKRGITIDLGFAKLDLGVVRIGFVDVPGHEKFVKNMLAGAGGIDLVVLVVAADEGVMPQTREHFEICRLLETKHGLIVLTKKDLVDDEFIELVKYEVSELVKNSFLEKAPVVAVSTKTFEGLNELKEILKETTTKISPRKNETVSRLPIDRVFTVKGFGAVVTGTLIAGKIKSGSEMEILPIGKRVRVRSIQTHGKDAEKATAGQRVAVNLGGIDHVEIKRGMILGDPGVLHPTQIFDAKVEVLFDAACLLKSRQRVRVHIGTLEVFARIEVLNKVREIKQGEKDFMQIRLESPTISIPGERFILRRYSPQVTIGGGSVLDNDAKKHPRRDIENVRKYLHDLVESIHSGNKVKRLKLVLETANERGLRFSDLQARTGWRDKVLQRVIYENVEKKAIVKADNFYISQVFFDTLTRKVLSEIKFHHKSEPLSKGVLRETLRERIGLHIPVDIFRETLNFLEDRKKVFVEKDIVRDVSHNQELSTDEKKIKESLLKIYANAGLQVPTLESVLKKATLESELSTKHVKKIFHILLTANKLVKVTENLYFTKEVLESLILRVVEYAENETENRLITVPIFKEIAGTSRKYAIPLLEYFDRENITRRVGDKRLIL